MMQTSHSNIGIPSRNLDEIKNKVSEEDIFTHFFGKIKIPSVINSPFRKDKNPSFNVFYSLSGTLLFHDFGTNQTWNVYSLLMDYFNCSFQEVLNIICKELKTEFKPNISIHNSYKQQHKRKNINIEVQTRDFKDYDLQFWEQYGINENWLKFGQIYPITYIFINDHTIPADKYAYAYAEFKDDITTFKIYQPYNKKFKWMSSHNKSVWDLWNQLPKSGNNLIITSSRKDALCLWANLNIPTTALQGEGYIPKDGIIQDLKQRFKNIFVLYDNDKTGIEKGQELANKFGLIYIELPNVNNSKDPSDFFKNNGKQEFIKTLNYVLKSKK